MKLAHLAATAGIVISSGIVAHADDRLAEIVVAAATEPTVLASANAYNANSRTALGNVFEALIARDPQTNKIVPELAASWERIDESTVHFNLREGVMFHDGTKLDAEGVAAALAYVWSDNDSFNLKDNGPDFTFTAVDSMTLEAKTESPDPRIIERLWAAYVPSPAQIMNDPDDYLVNAIGTGPYRFVEWNRGTNIILEANEDWWGLSDPDGRGGIYYERARFELRPEAASRIAALQAGEVQVAERLPAEPCLNTLGKDCRPAPDVTTSYFRLDGMNPVLGDVRIRLAMSMAIDREAIGDLLGGARPAAMIVGPSATGFNPDLEPHAFDMEKAKNLVAEAKADGVPIDSTPLRMISMRNAFAGNEDVLEIALESFRQIGLDNIEASIVEKGQFGEVFIRAPRPIPEDRGLIVLHKHGNSAFDFGPTVGVFYLCGQRNSTSCNPRVDELQKTATGLSGTDRQKAYAEIAAILHEDNNIIPMHHVNRYHGIASALEWTPRLDSTLLLKDIKPGSS